MEVDRRTALVLFIGAIGIVALILSAATLTDTTGSESAGGGWIDLGLGERSQGEIVTVPISVPFVGQYLDPLWTIIAVSLLVFAAALIVVLDVEDILPTLVGAVGTILFLALIVLLVNSTSLAEIEGQIKGFSSNATSAPIESSQTASPGSGFPVYLLGAGLLVALLAVVAIIYQTGDEELDEPEPEDDERSSDEQLRTVGDAAGRAADAIADDETEPDNAVYRAWVEMTAALDVTNRESTTPGEFATEAIEAGMDPEDVSELTRLFEDVRYGDEPVSDERIEQAQTALRRIEATYAEEEQ